MSTTADTQETIRIIESIDQSSFQSDADRYAAKEAARRLLARLETPFERGWALAFETPVLVTGLQERKVPETSQCSLRTRGDIRR
jgi:hypothetical protein